MRELDNDCMELCDVYVDSRASAFEESGDVILSKVQKYLIMWGPIQTTNNIT